METKPANDFRLGFNTILPIAVQLDQELSGGIRKRELFFEQPLYGFQTVLFHKFNGGRNNPVGDNLRHAVGGREKVVERYQQINLNRRKGNESENNLGHHGQGAFGSNQQLNKIVAGNVFYQLSATANDLA